MGGDVMDQITSATAYSDAQDLLASLWDVLDNAPPEDRFDEFRQIMTELKPYIHDGYLTPGQMQSASEIATKLCPNDAAAEIAELVRDATIPPGFMSEPWLQKCILNKARKPLPVLTTCPWHAFRQPRSATCREDAAIHPCRRRRRANCRKTMRRPRHCRPLTSAHPAGLR
jgi:hypothetical protein